MSRLLLALVLLAGWLPVAEGLLDKVSPGWDPNGLSAGSTTDVGPGWDPDGLNAEDGGGSTADVSLGWDPNG
ncbi:MAG TPA: hypothetical protein VJ725_10450 [Thermoanaerobaculia bacterium]|nr:hypothetical protein [Thermoanaerobaculia bacterium]